MDGSIIHPGQGFIYWDKNTVHEFSTNERISSFHACSRGPHASPPGSCLPPAPRSMRGGSPGQNSEACGSSRGSRHRPRRGDFRSLRDFGSLRQRLQQPGPPSYPKTRRSVAVAEAAGTSEVLPATCSALYQSGEREKGIALMQQALAIFAAIESPSRDWARDKLQEWGIKA